MSVAWKHDDGPGKISGSGRNGTPTLDFERLTTGQLVLVSVDFQIDPKKEVGFEIVAADGDAQPVTPNKTCTESAQHIYKRVIFRVTKEADAAIGVVEVNFEVNFTGGKGKGSDFTLIGETASEH